MEKHHASVLSLLFLTVLIQVILQIVPGEAVTITIINLCKYTVWPAVVPNQGAITDSFALQNGELNTINIGESWAGQIWGRTLCSNNSLTGNFSCEIGDCGTGRMDCQRHSYTPPVTLIEFSVSQITKQQSVYYDVSLVNGYNLPVTVSPQDAANGMNCGVTGCVFNMNSECPEEFRVTNNNSQDQSIIACKSPCNVFQTPEFCCTDSTTLCSNFSLGSLIFKKTCPRAYSYALDDVTSTFFCADDKYVVTFCPPANLASVVSQPSHSASPMPSASPSPSPSSYPTRNREDPNSKPIGDSKAKKKKLIYLSVGLSALAVFLVFITYGVYNYANKTKVKGSSASLEVTEIKKAVLDSLQYNLDTIRAATENFATHNKLGEGGFGEVYKGKLENQQEIAVKRLSKNSGQGVVEYKTEVTLVAKLRHKNLVKLLGYCVAMEEKILVYEFLSNSSLDRILFDQSRQASLKWERRFNIIIGIARGLLYLHEDSPLKVIHRDLKSSNILLDRDMNAKISDFGLAKLFGAYQTQGDTRRIVGTYGYMAPEYAITGHYSAKSDVYSFGVIVLEIVSGQRNRVFGHLQVEEALLHRAWRLWNEGKALDLVDTTLENCFLTEEVVKCIQLGLLCIQEDSTMRPRMSSIVASLNGQDISFPSPKPPNFFGIANNFGDNERQHNSFNIYSGTKTITEVYSRD